MMESCLMFTGKEKKLSNAVSAMNVIEDIAILKVQKVFLYFPLTRQLTASQHVEKNWHPALVLISNRKNKKAMDKNFGLIFVKVPISGNALLGTKFILYEY